MGDMPFRITLRRGSVSAILATAILLPGLQALQPIAGDMFSLHFFLAAVALASWCGGLGAGLTATALGVAASICVYAEPLYPLHFPKSGERLHLILLLCIGCLLSLAVVRLKKARQRTEEASQEQEQWFEDEVVKHLNAQRQYFADKLLLSSLNGIYILNVKTTRATYINAQFMNLTGYAPDACGSLDEQNFFNLFHPEDRAKVAAHLRELEHLADYESVEIEYRFRTADERWIWCFSRNTVFARDADGSVREILGTFFDITERKLADLAMAYERSLFDALQTTAPVGLGLIDRDFCFIRVNETLADMNGRPSTDHLGRTVAEILPGLWPQLEPMLRRVLQMGESLANVEVDGELGIDSGNARHWLVNLYPVHLKREIIGIGVVVVEITALKRAKCEVRKLNAALAKRVTELDTLFELAPIGLMISEDPECQHIRMNKALAQLMDVPQTLNASLSAPPEKRPPWKVLRGGRRVPPEELPLQKAAALGRPVVENGLEWRLHNGKVFRMMTYAAPLVDEHGQTRGAMGAFLDVTERMKLEEELKRHAEHLQAINRRKDEFLATLAHELRNPLAPILNAAHVLRRSGSPDPKTVQWAAAIITRQIEHLAHLVNDLLDVSRITRGKISLDKKTVDIATVIDRAVEASSPIMETRRHTLHVSPPPPGVTVDGDEVRLVQIVTNLLDNAAKYSKEEKRIWLSTELRENEVAIRIRDEGAGIPADLLPVIFDLFAQGDRTLARSEGGLGIGLSLVKSLVEMHEGCIEAYSAGEGWGSEFVVRLPLCKAHPPDGAEPPALPSRHGASAGSIALADEAAAPSRSPNAGRDRRNPQPPA
jgi:PAS domain S-box-containing protein